MKETRDVRTGRKVDSAAWCRYGYRLGEAWFLVTTFSCRDGCICEGFEVVLNRCNRQASSSFRGPVHPVISVSTEKDAKAMTKKLIAFVRTLDPMERILGHDPRICEWLASEGFSKRNHIMWSRGGEDKSLAGDMAIAEKIGEWYDTNSAAEEDGEIVEIEVLRLHRQA